MKKNATIQTDRFVSRILISLVVMETGLLFLDSAARFLRASLPLPVYRLFNMTREDSICNWFSSILTLSTALVLWIFWVRARRDPESGVKKGHKAVWMILALMFSYMAIDDGAQLHERLGSALFYFAVNTPIPPLSRLFNAFPSYPWQVMFALFFGTMLFLLVYLAFFGLNNPSSRWAILSGTGLFVLAVAMDFIEGVPLARQFPIADFFSKNPAMGHALKAIEEYVEMIGMTFMLTGFLKNTLVQFQDWRFSFR